MQICAIAVSRRVQRTTVYGKKDRDRGWSRRGCFGRLPEPDGAGLTGRPAGTEAEMGKALTWIGGIVLAVLSALLVIPHLVDWNRYRGTFEEEASRALGREVRVGGGVNLRLLPSPYVRFEKIRISDTAGTLGEPFFRAESFTMGLSITPLLRGALEATEIELQQPVLTLAVDADGRGNWRDVGLAPAATYLPAEVRLKAVRIIGGQVAVKGLDGPLLQLTQIDGDLSSEGLTGPYKFRGNLAKDGVVRDVRLSTAPPDPNGALRFKAIVHAPQSGATYNLDGRLLDLAGKPKFDGEVTARVSLPATASSASPADPSSKASDGDMLELRSQIRGDAFGFVLPDIAITVEQGAQPQLVNGDATISWRDGLRLKLALTSKWLDLDRIAPSKPEAGPVAAARTLVPTLVALLPETGQVDARLTIDQVTLGGEVASAARLHLERFRGPMLVRELQAALPGGSKLDLAGTLTAQGGEHTFIGDLSLRGTSHARLLGWAAKGQTLIDSRNDGPFALGGRLSLMPTGFELAGLSVEVNGTSPLTGSIAYASGARHRLDVRLEGQQIDLTSLLPGGLDPARVRTLLWPSTSSTPTAPEVKRGLLGILDTRSTDSRIAVRATEISDGERIYRDVDALFVLDLGKLTITQGRLTTAEGVKLEFEGEISGLFDRRPAGQIRGFVAADSVDATGSLLSALDVSAGAPGKARDAILARLSPVRLAGTLHLGERNPLSAGVTIDGLVRGARTVARINLDAGPVRWREGHVEGRLRMEGADAALALAQLALGDAAPALASTQSLKRGSAALDITGQPGKIMLTLASLKADGLSLSFDGGITAPPTATRAVEGTVRVEAARSEPVLSLLGLSAIGGLRDASLKGAVEISSSADALRIKSRGLAVGGTEVAGLMTLTKPSGAPTVIDASLFVAKASLSELLTPLLAASTSQNRDAQVREGQLPPIWPDRPFDTAALDTVQGRFKLSMGTFSLGQGLNLADASIDAELAPGQIKITNLDGRALGGELKARFVLEKAPMAGAALAGALRIDDARLESLAGKSAASGPGNFLAQFSGRALTPLALVQALQGKGEISLGAGQILRHSPSSVPRAIDTVLDGKADAGGEGLKKVLLEGLAASPVRLPATKLALLIADGAVKIQKLDIATEDARGSIETTIELGSMKFDSEWRLYPKGPPKRVLASQATKTKALPGISLVYVGQLADIGTIEPRIDTEALERVLVVLRMERDVEELERLRREDEERIRHEIERQKTLEEERKKAIEEGRATSAGPVVAPAAPVEPVPSPATGSASTAGTTPGGAGMAPAGSPPRFEVRSGPPSAATDTPAVPDTAPPSASAQVSLPGQNATDVSPLVAQPPVPADGTKRPARLGPPRPSPAQKFNPFGPPGLGTN